MKQSKPVIYAIIPARSDSKGISNKNIKQICGIPLIGFSIACAKSLDIDKIICSTDSHEYAKIAIKYGAEVPFLRSSKASSDTAMEQDILFDLYTNFETHGIKQPDYIIWLRPTFVFRDLSLIKDCIYKLEKDKTLTSARIISKTECRLYNLKNNLLTPDFNDDGLSMIRRQDIGNKYKVYSTDIIRSNDKNYSNDFLGRKIYAKESNKICGLDIDDNIDFEIVQTLIKYRQDLVGKYMEISCE
tara:strand:- start:3847 stop:4578 length:732 start_codon:yes stop_codon:yes gene_type:complete